MLVDSKLKRSRIFNKVDNFRCYGFKILMPYIYFFSQINYNNNSNDRKKWNLFFLIKIKK